MKTSRVFCLALTVLLFSCDDEEIMKGPAVVGHWSITALEYSDISTTVASGFTLTTETTGFGKNMNIMAMFSENPNLFTVEGSYTDVQTMTALGKTTTEEIEIDSTSDNGSWSLIGNELTMVSKTGSQTGTISDYSGDTFTLRFKTSQDTVLVDGFTVVYTIDLTCRFKRKKM